MNLMRCQESYEAIFIEAGKKAVERTALAATKRQLVALIKRVSDQAKSEALNNSWDRRVVVSSDKAYLYGRPSSDAMTKAYLVKGDMVTVHGRLHDVFLKITYVTQRGQAIEKFILCNDVDLWR